MSAKKFQNYLKENNFDHIQVIISKKVTRTAQEAANTHEVSVSNIAKSLIVNIDGKFELFITPGHKRLDLDNLKTERNASKVRMAHADEVKQITGYSIGGVPPFGHEQKLETTIVKGFNPDEKIFAAAGSHNAVFETNLKQLQEIIGD